MGKKFGGAWLYRRDESGDLVAEEVRNEIRYNEMLESGEWHDNPADVGADMDETAAVVDRATQTEITNIPIQAAVMPGVPGMPAGQQLPSEEAREMKARMDAMQTQINALIQQVAAFIGQSAGGGATPPVQEPLQEPPPEDEDIPYERFKAIFSSMLVEDPDKDSTELWTKAGRPHANYLERMLGREVRATTRDSMWERFETEGGEA